jgi:inorganic pyrophosphatase/exopolyphosphatase
MDTKRNNTTEEVLNSLDGIQKATMPDFFYTRLKARMEKGYEPAVPVKSWIFRPAYAVAALMLVLIINAAVIFKNRETKASSNPEIESLQSIAAEYNLNETITEEVYK